MENERNTSGRFVKGHNGLKPKGAVSRKSQEYMARVEWVMQLLEQNLDENVRSLPAKEQVSLWLDLNKYIFAKRPPEKEEPKDKIDKITFQLIHSYPDGKPYDGPLQDEDSF